MKSTGSPIPPFACLAVCSLAIVVALPVAGADNDGPESTAPEAPRRGAPIEFRDDPPIEVPPESRRTNPARRWVEGVHVSVQVNVDSGGNNIVGDAANEPSIAVDPTDPNRMAIGWRQFDTIARNFRQAGYGLHRRRRAHLDLPRRARAGRLPHRPGARLPTPTAPSTTTAWPDRPRTTACDVFSSTDGGVTWELRCYAYGGDKAVDDDRPHRRHRRTATSTRPGTTPAAAATTASPAPSTAAMLRAAGRRCPRLPCWGAPRSARDGTVYVAGSQPIQRCRLRCRCARQTAQDRRSHPGLRRQLSTVDLGGEPVYFLGSAPTRAGCSARCGSPSTTPAARPTATSTCWPRWIPLGPATPGRPLRPPHRRRRDLERARCGSTTTRRATGPGSGSAPCRWPRTAAST